MQISYGGSKCKNKKDDLFGTREYLSHLEHLKFSSGSIGINVILIRIRGFPPGSKLEGIIIRFRSFWSLNKNRVFTKILTDRWNSFWIENSDGILRMYEVGYRMGIALCTLYNWGWAQYSKILIVFQKCLIWPKNVVFKVT